MLTPINPAKKLFPFNERKGIICIYSSGASQIKFGTIKLAIPIQKKAWKMVTDALGNS